MSNKRKIEELISEITNEEVNNRDAAHNKSKETAKEKIEALLDEKSFVEIEPLYNRGIIAGYGSINGRPVCIYAQDIINDNGALTVANVKKIIKTFDMAVKVGCPVISILENLRINVEENLDVLNEISKLIEKQVSVSGVIPQIAILFDSVIGGMAYSVALNDFVYTVKKQEVSATLEKVKKFNNSNYKADDKNDIISFEFETKAECFNDVRRLLEYIPANNLADTEIYDVDLNKMSYNLNELMSGNFDVRSVINEIVDIEFLEIKSDLNNQEVIGLSRIGGRTIGLVANQCFETSGSLDSNSFNKIGRFVRFCDAFNLPIVTLINAKGYDLKANSDIINAGSRLMYAYAEATVPKINVLIGDAFGSMYIALGNIGKDITYAWPNVNMGVLKTETLVSIKDSQNISNNNTRNEKIEEYKNNNEDVLNALNKGYIDDIIEPATTRQRIISALELFINKRENRPVKKHGNIPF